MPLLIKLSDTLDIDLRMLSKNEEGKLIAELQEVFADPLFADQAPDREEIGELAGVSPAACQGLLFLYSAYRTARDDSRHLGERLSGDSFVSDTSHRLRDVLTAIRSFSEILHDNADLEAEERQRFLAIVAELSGNLSQTLDEFLGFVTSGNLDGAMEARSPVDEAAEFIYAHDNYFDEIEREADALLRELGTANALHGALADRLRERFGIATEFDAVGDVDRTGTAPPSELDDAPAALAQPGWPPHGAATFRLASRLGEAQCGEVIERLVEDGRFSTSESAQMVRETLAKYFAAAVV